MDIFSFFQVDALRWRALAQQAKDESQRIHFKVLFEALKGLEKQWDKDLLSCEEVGNILTSCSYQLFEFNTVYKMTYILAHISYLEKKELTVILYGLQMSTGHYRVSAGFS